MTLGMVLIGIAATFYAITTASAQPMKYTRGSVHDLDPPARQSTSAGDGTFEALVNSKRRNFMREIRDIGPGDRIRRLAQPIGRLAIGLKGGGVSYCTASLISADLLLTNYHCVPGDGNVHEVVLWMGYERAGSQRGVKKYKVTVTPLEADVALDYAILRAQDGPGDTWGQVSLGTVQPASGRSMLIVHHPGGTIKHVTRGGCWTSDPATSGSDILHTCDTLSGSSGAPIFDNNSDQVIGLHNRAAGPEVNAGKLISSLVKVSKLIAELVSKPRATSPKSTSSRGYDVTDPGSGQNQPPTRDTPQNKWIQ